LVRRSDQRAAAAEEDRGIVGFQRAGGLATLSADIPDGSRNLIPVTRQIEIGMMLLTLAFPQR